MLAGSLERLARLGKWKRNRDSAHRTAEQEAGSGPETAINCSYKKLRDRLNVGTMRIW